MLTLYHAAHSTCSQKVRLVLHEKSLRFDEHLVNLATNEHLAPEYLALNPNGVVPTLVHDGTVVTDSSVILEYLDEVFPAPSLTPDTPAGRARMRAWMRFLEEVPTAAVRAPSFNAAFLPRYAGLSDDEFEAQQAGIRPLRRGFYRKMGRHGFDDAAVEESLTQLRLTARRIHAAVQNGPWLVGDRLTLADFVAAPLIDRMADLGQRALWETDYPGVTDWLARLRARPAYDKTFFPGARLTDRHLVTSIKGKHPLAAT